MVSIVFGCLIGWIGRRGRIHSFVAIAITCVCLGDMSFQNGVMPRLSQGNMILVARNEDWRSAIRWVNQHEDDLSIASVWVDPGLIEQVEPDVIVKDPIRENYFRFVADGPYRFNDTIQVIGMGRRATDAWQIQCQSGDAGKRTLLLTRRMPSRELFQSPKVQVRSFGAVFLLSSLPEN